MSAIMYTLAGMVDDDDRSLRLLFREWGASTSVVIYDAQGRVVFYPYSSRSVSKSGETFYRFERSGLYLIGLVHDGVLMRTEKITITR